MKKNTKPSKKLSKKELDALFVRANYAEDTGDHRSAFRMFLRGAKSGDSTMMGRLARCYFDGIGVKQNLNRALEWEMRAYRKGGGMALNIGITHRFLCRHEESVKWLERASAKGDAAAHIELAIVYLRLDDPVKARNYARKALKAKLVLDASQIDLEMAYWLLYGLESVGKRATKQHPVFKNYRAWVQRGRGEVASRNSVRQD